MDPAFETIESEERPVWRSMTRGWRRRCPSCGNGPMMDGYLKVRDDCPVCEEELHHQRADDGPAYLTILVVAHIVGIFLGTIYVVASPDPVLVAIGLSIAVVALSLYFLPRLKGMLVGIQWAKRMGGFGDGKPHQP